MSDADRVAADVAQAMNAHDKDRDGKLSLAEWHTSGPPGPGDPMSDARALWVEQVTAKFNELDEDGDGHVSIEEYQARVRADVRCLDEDGDGRVRDEEVRTRMGACAARGSRP